MQSLLMMHHILTYIDGKIVVNSLCDCYYIDFSFYSTVNPAPFPIVSRTTEKILW